MAAIQMAGQATPWRRAAEGSGEPTTGRAPGTGPLFFLGTHQAAWLWDERAACHLFVSHRRLKRYKRLHPATHPWTLDSGGFTELSKSGRWMTSPREYAEAVARYQREIGRLLWADSAYDRGAKAFEYAAGPAPENAWSWDPMFSWHCPACDEAVIDRGPYESHPEDNSAATAQAAPASLPRLLPGRQNGTPGTLKTTTSQIQRRSDRRPWKQNLVGSFERRWRCLTGMARPRRQAPTQRSSRAGSRRDGGVRPPRSNPRSPGMRNVERIGIQGALRPEPSAPPHKDASQRYLARSAG
jgi:hypothetical protein